MKPICGSYVLQRGDGQLSGLEQVFSFVFWGSSSHIFGPRNDIFSEL